MEFKATIVSRADRFAIGVDEDTGKPCLSFPVSNSLLDYVEYYALSKEEFERFSKDIGEAKSLAERCKQHLEDNRLIFKPGTDRGVPS